MFVFVPELFKCNSKLLWRLGSLIGVREAVPKQCSVEEKKTVLVVCGPYFGKGYMEWFPSVAGGAEERRGKAHEVSVPSFVAGAPPRLAVLSDVCTCQPWSLQGAEQMSACGSCVRPGEHFFPQA